MTLKKMLPEQLNEKMKNKQKLVLLDVRAPEKYAEYHIEHESIQSINIFKENILQNNDDSIHPLSKDNEIIVTCTTGNSAARCAAVLSDKGYNVAVLEGGITAWKNYLSTNK